MRKRKLEKLDIGNTVRERGWREEREKGCGDVQDTASQKSFSGLEMLSKQCINSSRKEIET